MLLNRICQFAFAQIAGESFGSCVEAFLGIKIIVDTYHIVSVGPTARMNGGSSPIKLVRMIRTTIGMICESIPQMILQCYIFLTSLISGEFTTGMILIQVVSIASTCFAGGFVTATQAFDQHSSHIIKGEEVHPSIAGNIIGLSYEFEFIRLALFLQ